MARWERWENCEAQRREVPGFIKGWGTQHESKISSFSFWCLSRERRGGMGSRFSCVAARMERLSLDLSQAVKDIVYGYLI